MKTHQTVHVDVIVTVNPNVDKILPPGSPAMHCGTASDASLCHWISKMRSVEVLLGNAHDPFRLQLITLEFKVLDLIWCNC
jgi:hypothetical protein